MALFRYKAADLSGKTEAGLLEANTSRQALEELTDMGLIPVSLSRELPPKAKPLQFRELYAFTQQLANLLAAGLPLSEALETIRQHGSTSTAPIVEQILSSVRSGSTLAAALDAQNCFPSFYVAMVRAGEAGGNLEENLQRLAADIENQEQVRRQLKLTLLYPVVMLGATLCALILLVAFILPRFQELFAQIGGELPLATRIVLALGQFFLSWRWPILGVFIAALAWVLYLRLSPQGRRVWDQHSLKLPVLGPLLSKVQYVRFARTVGRLLSGGVGLPESLEIAQGSLDNYLLRQAAARVQEGIQKGGSPAVLLKEQGIFPPLAMQMLSSGERAGNLEEMLLRTADLFQKESEGEIKTLLALLEPLVIILLGLVVLIVVLAIIVPLLGINMLQV
jgi:general secretion pathway protein F